MFGYIRPLECELRVREQSEYRAHYCGLCKTIGRRCGQIARLTLNYDCAFLSAFCSAQEGACSFEPRRCICHPFRGRMPMATQNPSTDYAADVNVLLAWYAACDGWEDERRLSSLMMRLLFGRAKKKAAINQPELSKQIQSCLAQLRGLELNDAACTDEPSDAFGRLMRAVIAHAPASQNKEQEAREWMFYNLGRWIYLADAWDDREKDEKRGSYNPFLAAGTDRQQAEFLLNVSLTEAQRGYDLLTMNGPHGLIDNIMELGCRQRTQQLFSQPSGTPEKRAEDTKENAE